MNKKNIPLIIIFGIIAVGVTFFLFSKVLSFVNDTKENVELTKQMSPTLLEMLKDKDISEFPYAPAAIEWEGKFLQVDGGAVLELQGIARFMYNRQRNEALNMHQFLQSSDINGIVWISPNAEIVGQYVGGGQAFRPYYVLSFLDLKQQAILAQDTVWGGMPPKTISKGSMGASGKSPEEEVVVETIQKRIK